MSEAAFLSRSSGSGCVATGGQLGLAGEGEGEGVTKAASLQVRSVSLAVPRGPRAYFVEIFRRSLPGDSFLDTIGMWIEAVACFVLSAHGLLLTVSALGRCTICWTGQEDGCLLACVSSS